MIEVGAQIPRGPVFLAGETIESHITFTNPKLDPSDSSHSNSEVCETLAWASAQIHCQCTVDERKVQFPHKSQLQEETATGSQETSFVPCKGESGHVAIATQPKILFCDLRLLPGESKTYIYKEVLPAEAPPSYRGHAVKYAYKITVGTQRVNSAIQLLRIPIRVLVIPGFLEVMKFGDCEEVTPSNPFVQNVEKECPLELALQILQNMTARKYPSYYNVTNSRGKVVRFCLFKNSFKLGEDIVGTLDFSFATVQCVQFSVTLKSEEKVNDENKVIRKQNPSVISYSKCHEYCLHMKKTQMVLPVPFNVTPTFSTNFVSLSWKLHFEFVTTTDNAQSRSSVNKAETDNTLWIGPSDLNIETMVWDLPVTICPCNPVQVFCGLHMKNAMNMII